MLEIYPDKEDEHAIEFCRSFLNSSVKYRYVFGINEFAESIATQIDVAGFIDEFTDQKTYLNKPIIKLNQIPLNSMVVSAVIGRPITVKIKLDNININNIDYFAFHKYSGLDLKPIRFWSDFKKNYFNNKKKYNWIYSELNDDESKKTLSDLINFRLSNNLKFMYGYTDRQDTQYFEDFLELKKEDETFVDIGGYDGFTSIEFIKRCPRYSSIHLFEPDEENIKKAKNNLKTVLKFQSSGSTSIVSEIGDKIIDVDKLDNIINGPVTFIKMDIEGGEYFALEGSRNCINKCHPKLAICVYHKTDDLYKIPELITSIRNDYKIYLRHYTEGVDETVMYFVPNNE